MSGLSRGTQHVPEATHADELTGRTTHPTPSQDGQQRSQWDTRRRLRTADPAGEDAERPHGGVLTAGRARPAQDAVAQAQR